MYNPGFCPQPMSYEPVISMPMGATMGQPNGMPMAPGYVPPVNTGMIPPMGGAMSMMGGGQQPCFKCHGSGRVYGVRTCRA